MKEVYQFIGLLKLQILSKLSSNASVTTPGFPIFLALIFLLAIPILVTPDVSATQFIDTTRVMIIVYSLLVVGVVWKFISYMRENRSSRLDEVS